MGRWARRMRSLGRVFIEVLQAEVETLLADLQAMGKGWLQALLLFVAAAAFAFWSVGVLTTFAIVLLAGALGLWQAAGVVFLVLAMVTAGLAFAGFRLLRRQRAPTAIVKGHLEDQLEWWRENLEERESRAARRPLAEAPRPSESEEEAP